MKEERLLTVIFVRGHAVEHVTIDGIEAGREFRFPLLAHEGVRAFGMGGGVLPLHAVRPRLGVVDRRRNQAVGPAFEIVRRRRGRHPGEYGQLLGMDERAASQELDPTTEVAMDVTEIEEIPFVIEVDWQGHVDCGTKRRRGGRGEKHRIDEPKTSTYTQATHTTRVVEIPKKEGGGGYDGNSHRNSHRSKPTPRWDDRTEVRTPPPR